MRKGIMNHLGKILLAALMMVFFSCATPNHELTPFDIYGDPPQRGPIGGERNLSICQYFLSTPMSLEYYNREDSGPQITASGAVRVETTAYRETIDFVATAPGVLRAKNGIEERVTSDGEPIVVLRILFEDSEDDYLEFYAYKSEPDDFFSLVTDADGVIQYGGQPYQVYYEGEVKPYLWYQLLQSETEIATRRTVRGRRVGQ
jgi:hypothetical protein